MVLHAFWQWVPAYPSRGSGQTSFFTELGVWSGLPTSHRPSVHTQSPFPLATREKLRNFPCFLTAVNKFIKSGGSRALVIHILARATVDVALISTPIYVYLGDQMTRIGSTANFPLKCTGLKEQHLPLKSCRHKGWREQEPTLIQHTAYWILIIKFSYTVSCWWLWLKK